MLVLVVGVLVAARLVQKRAVDADLRVVLGAHAASARALTLVFTDARDHVERELELRFDAGGAPAVVERRVHLHAGAYTVGARVESAGAPSRTVSRAIAVDEAGVYTLDLSN